MNKIQEVKERADIVRVAEILNIKTKQCCPFHKEKTPSFSISARKQIFKCFGCGKGGDVITLVSELMNIDSYKSAQYINDLCCLGVNFNQKTSMLEINRYKQKQKAKENFKKWENKSLIILSNYFQFLNKKQDEETYKNINKIEYYIDILIFGSDEDKLEFYKLNKKVVEKIERRLSTV